MAVLQSAELRSDRIRQDWRPAGIDLGQRNVAARNVSSDCLEWLETRGDQGKKIMDAFNEREKAIEEAFAHEEEIRFKILARRNAMMTQWAAAKLGYAGEAANRYIESIANALGASPRGARSAEDRLIARLSLDLTTCDWDFARENLRKVLADFEAKARTDIMAHD